MASINQTDIDVAPEDGTRAAEFGASLREIRLAHQRELSDVTEDLRIRQVYLRAMEEGRFDDLPGPAYAVGFVRAYADYLGLDVEEVVRSFKELGVASNRQPNLVPPSPVTEGRLPTGSIMLVAAVLAAAAYGGWYQTSLEGENAVESLAALPQRIAALVGMRPEPEEPQAPEASQPSQPSPAAAIEPATEPGDTTAREYPPETGADLDLEPATGGDGAAAAPATTETALQAEPSAAPAEPPAAPVESSATQATGGDAEPAQGDADSEPAEAAARSAAAPETSVPEPPAAAPAVTSAAATQTPPPTAPETVEAAAQPKPPQAAKKREPAPMTAMAAEPAASADVASGAPAASPSAPVSAAPPAPKTAETPAAAQQTASAADSTEAVFRVTVRATTTAWVEVRGSDNKPVFSRMMQSGEAVDLPVTPGMTLSTGNAGGIEILVDGAVLPPLGPNGAVRRNFALDAKALLKYSGRTE